ncbi:PSD1 and planctomycete cytochrome C domain-containing protein [Rhodopirellula halodulae]|uniref:PSD1 and planctomycete cytochrome C domain-containing protein n=1 Tax=Rhodopirellula halodulae TaxID=2894198 RepID=UPI001E291FB5|nr:PSD1 and planctomycete cytochrome C domain-containing protein [Rhodopirellula sp. JC737]MCC9656059.1 PSD1 and planctomycete cytochrome C domain-containing protein [Rhodopirellula sp. JC737]
MFVLQMNYFNLVLRCSIVWLATGFGVPATSRAVDFGADIQPILNEHCLACHGGVKQAGDLSFIHRDSALSVIEPGDVDGSYMIDRIVSEDEDEVMPPPEHGAPLSEKKIALLKEWIQEGAQWKQAWGYEPPVAPEIPQIENPDACRQTIDHFVRKELQEKGVEPAKDAPPHQWLRRVTLDLTGVPPTLQEVREFEADANSSGDAAYADKVDQLLQTPGYGERWASVWLDQIRYADSRGLGLDGRRNAWKYRDWVIDALNDDMPFDEFTIKQIAGDLLPDPDVRDLLATTASRLTQTNEEGGTDDEEFRVSAVLDRVSTVWQTWQGITFGCVQCHSHPYDPIEHDEFYEFMAFFNNTVDCDLNGEDPLLSVPLDPKDEARATQLDRKLRPLRQQVWQQEYDAVSDASLQWTHIESLKASATKQTKVDVEQREGRTEFFTIDTLSNGTTVSLDCELPESTDQLTAIRTTFLPRDPKTALADSEWGFVLSHLKAVVVDSEGNEQELEFSHVIADEPQPLKNPRSSMDSKNSDGFAAYSRIHHARVAVFLLKDAAKVTPGSRLKLDMSCRVQALGAFPLVVRRGSVDVCSDPAAMQVWTDERFASKRDELSKLSGERRSIKSVRIPIMRERPDHLARPSHVFIRGLFLTKDKQVQPDVPAAMPPLSGEGPYDRMDLAKWLVDPSNPLTARVTVNRIWARLFGLGLVPTEEDFGSSGERPTHPELLDHLALKFQNELGWSWKQLIRSIVLSSTYRQDSTIDPDSEFIDEQNRWLARGPRFRMPAEMVRDQALFVSGLLSPDVHGAPVHPPIPDGVWKPFHGGDKWSTPEVGHPDRYRRSIYTYTKRSIPYPMFAAFDAPSREFCTPRRLRSNTPLQALTTLNDTTFVECTQALAKRIQKLDGSVGDQLCEGFELVTSRKPTDAERRILVTLHEQASQTKQESDAEQGLAAYEAVASALLNLDEIMSK